jgi:carbamoyl-phosphate synthase large subunit
VPVEICVVVTGVGGGVGQSVMKGLSLANQNYGRGYRVIGVDANPLSAGLYRADKGYKVPLASDEADYIDALIEIMNREEASVLVPGSDPEVVCVSKHRESIEKATGGMVLVSPLETVLIGYDKWRTYEFLTQNGFAAPESALPEGIDELGAKVGFPLIVKPRSGSGSKNVSIVLNREELNDAIEHTPEPIIQEYLIPVEWGDKDLTREQLGKQVDEYSTEVWASKDSQVLGSITNWREMAKGVPMRAIIKPFREIRDTCEEVVAEMKARGPVNLQARVTDRGVTIFEINTRFSGSTAVRCAAGFNGPDALIRHFLFDEPVTHREISFKNLVEMRFKHEVYVEETDYEKMESSGCTSGSVGTIYDYF